MKHFICSLLVCTSLVMTGQNQQSHELDIEKSVINWKGTYAFQFSEHSGIVYFKEGQLETNHGNIVGGSFVIDMTSITNKDYELDQGPVAHLKDPDFFDVMKFPESNLKIEKVTYVEEENTHKMEGKLTIKGITKTIEFWAIVDGAKKIMNTRFIIDRKRWGITYNNKLKNQAISDAIEFEAMLFF